MAVNKTRAKLEDVPAHDRERFLKAQAKRERRAKAKKEEPKGDAGDKAFWPK